MINQIMNYLSEIKFDAIYLVAIIFFLTFLQKYHFRMLYYIKARSNRFVNILVVVVLRIGVIIHEFSHLLFWLLFGAKIKKIELFKKNWGQVSFATKDYIANIAFIDKNKFRYFLKLLYNRIWIFLTSLGPLIVGIFLNILIINLFTGNQIFSLNPDIDFSQIHTSLFLFSLLVIYGFLILPSFILSFKDISHFFFYKWQNRWASIIGSIINISTFIFFILIVAQRFDYILAFAILYFLSFSTLLILFFVFYILLKIRQKKY